MCLVVWRVNKQGLERRNRLKFLGPQVCDAVVRHHQILDARCCAKVWGPRQLVV